MSFPRTLVPTASVGDAEGSPRISIFFVFLGVIAAGVIAAVSFGRGLFWSM